MQQKHVKVIIDHFVDHVHMCKKHAKKTSQLPPNDAMSQYKYQSISRFWIAIIRYLVNTDRHKLSALVEQ